MTARPPEIQERHLRRKALAYIRQSSGTQVLENVGSTAIQRDLATLHEWGWPVDAIESRGVRRARGAAADIRRFPSARRRRRATPRSWYEG